jgi:RecA-family ATPase
VNFELRNHTIHDRINTISDARGITNDELLDLWDLRGFAKSIEEMVVEINERIQTRDPYSTIILDPTYKLLGTRDENAGGEMTEFCSNLEWLAQASGASVVAAAHFPKGAMGGTPDAQARASQEF